MVKMEALALLEGDQVFVSNCLYRISKITSGEELDYRFYLVDEEGEVVQIELDSMQTVSFLPEISYDAPVKKWDETNIFESWAMTK